MKAKRIGRAKPEREMGNSGSIYGQLCVLRYQRYMAVGKGGNLTGDACLEDWALLLGRIEQDLFPKVGFHSVAL